MKYLRACGVGSVAVLGLLVPTIASAQRTVFLNLEQQAINTDNGNDPSLNSYSSNSFMPGTVDGHPALDDAQRAELMYWFKHGTVPFDIHFTFERPAVGNYDMLVFGSEADNGELFPDLGCSASIGLADCTDTDLENISFMFWGCMPDNQQEDLRRLAFFGLTALGFGWGLEPVGVSGQIMGTFSQAGVEFGDSCVALDNAANCAHNGCAMGQQNSTADLTPVVGARVDDGPPVVTIVSPGDLEIVDPNVQVVANVEDQFGDVEVVLEIVEAGQALEDHVPPHDWGLTNIPQGMWTLRVSATDVDGNLTTAEVVVCVDVDLCNGVAEDTGGSSGGADETTTSGAGSSDGGDEDDGDETTSTSGGDSSGSGATTAASASATGGGISGTGFGENDADTGCGCTQRSSNTDAIAGALALLVLGARRRLSRRPRPAHPLR